MACLHPLAAVLTGADVDVEAAHNRFPNDFFLILGLLTLEFHAASAIRAALGKRNMDVLVDPRWNGPACVAAIPGSRFAPRRAGMGFRFSARKRRCLPLGGAQRRFQLLAQMLVFLLQPLDLSAQVFNALLRLLQNLFGDELDGLGWLFRFGLAARCCHSPLR
jgi:hypothetical protein